ncbi:XTP/dITP diphosphatase [Nitrospinae bacterium AH_259_B05_G02_I21]|nr:XTP/dITP diphosphatase [Nitrospinae bacterium AH_259_B05_G02_I21]
MTRLVVATRNRGKLDEIRAILASLPVEVASLADYPELEPIEEDGATFEANAVKKALHVAASTGHLTLADDSGIEVDALDGAPGVHSARFAGPEATDEANNAKLLELMAAVPDAERTARFRCVVAIATPEGHLEAAEGACEGLVARRERGDKGFGYDPLFFVPEYGMTFGELPEGIKNAISHRGRALAAARNALEALLAKEA